RGGPRLGASRGTGGVLAQRPCRPGAARGDRVGPRGRGRGAGVSARAPLVDGHGRRIGDLRVSVTDRCNFRCQYCMPAEGLPWLDRAEVLRFEEIERLVRVFASMGVTDVRLTGGEPLVPRAFPKLRAVL